MKPAHKILPILIILALTGLYLLGVAAVPFHPDEATQIFMSSDLETLFGRTDEIFYSDTPTDAARQAYRLLDAPLTRWLIGLGRWLAGADALPADWDWSLTWQQNQAAGALPSRQLLLVSRLSVAWLFGLSLYFAYRSGVILHGTAMGWFNLALTALNALILLHTRRAMAESALLFGVNWMVFMLAKKEARPWLLAIPAALALNAKQTAAALAGVALLAVWIDVWRISWQKRLRNALLYAIIVLLTTFALNPVAWKNPIRTAQAAVQARQSLAGEQVDMLVSVSPDLVMQSTGQRLSGWLVYLYFSPPAIADVANYLEETRSAEQVYFSNPIHNLGRNVAGGILLLILTLLGVALAFRRAFQQANLRIPLALLLLATLSVFLTLVLFIPLPFQRYVMPLISLSTLWIAFGLAEITAVLWQRIRIKTGKPEPPRSLR